MKALILRFEKRVDNIIKELLYGIDYSELEFDISYWESYGDDLEGSESDFNTMKEIPSKLIKQKVLIENNCVNPEFMELFIRKVYTMPKQIYSYKDFLESDYIISIISIDHIIIEICCKDSMLLEIIKNNFLKLDLQNKQISELEKVPLDAVLKAFRNREMKGIDSKC